MKIKVATILMLFSTLVPTYSASSNQEQLTELTKEQKKLKSDIEDKTADISDAQVQINTLNATIASNQAEIDSLNANIKVKQEDLDNQMSSFKSTLALLQRLNNSNALLAYMASSDEDNFLLKINNVTELSGGIEKNIQTVTSDLKSIKQSLSSAQSYKEQNQNNKTQAETLLATQMSTEADLKEQLKGVDSSVTSVKTQISLEQAAELEKQQQEAEAKAEAKAKAKADKEAKNKADAEAKASADTEEEADVAEPDVPEEPDVPDPEVPDIPDPDTGGSGYPSDGNVSGYKSQLLAAAGISSSDMTYVDYIITRESGWNYLSSNVYSGAYGLCQALPGSKMSSSGSDWATNPETQMSWCNSYAVSRYGSWQGAYAFWQANNWW